MYEEIHKPRLLKDVPLMLIRALPAVYYFIKYKNNNIPQKVLQLFSANVEFLAGAINEIGSKLDNKTMLSTASLVKELAQDMNDAGAALNELTMALSAECTKNKNELRALMRDVKPFLISLYKGKVPALKILLIDDGEEPEFIDKLSKTLQNFCFYNVEQISREGKNSAANIIASDFVIYTSISSPEIHGQVKSLDTYKMPGLAIASLTKDKESSIRHGAQLLKTGFPVLFKVFTPIRLFTSIEKSYIIYHLG